MRIIDMHCDTLLNCLRDADYKLSKNDGHISIEKLKQGGALAQFFAIYIAPEESAEMGFYPLFNRMYEIYKEQMELNSDSIKPALCVSDILKNKSEGKISALLSVEDGVILENKIERVQEVFDKGVRLITITWNFENSIGFPCSADPAEHMLKLKPFGIEVISEMNRLGMVIDVSHLSEGGFYDVAKYSKKPFVASHSCARALCNDQRNLTDDQLKTLGNQGGMVGVNFYSHFLEEASEYATIDKIVEHVVYMANKAGIDAVGLGSDFDGIECPLEFKDYAGFPLVLDSLSKHFTDDEMDKICNQNAFRLLKDNFGR